MEYSLCLCVTGYTRRWPNRSKHAGWTTNSNKYCMV